MRKSETDKSAHRLAEHFGRTHGRHLGIYNGEGVLLKKELLAGIEENVKFLLSDKWSESEIELGIFQAYKEKRFVVFPSALFTGKVPLADKKNGDRNLLTETTGYHSVLQERTMPVVSFDGENLVKEKSGELGKKLEVFTLKDLVSYWEKKGRGHFLSQTGEDAYGAFLWLLDKYTLVEILDAVDELFYSLGDRPHKGEDALNILNLNEILEKLRVQRKSVSGWN